MDENRTFGQAPLPPHNALPNPGSNNSVSASVITYRDVSRLIYCRGAGRVLVGLDMYKSRGRVPCKYRVGTADPRTC